MLDIQVTIENDKIVLGRLTAMMQLVPDAVDRGLKRAAKGIHPAAMAWLRGSGAKASNVPGGGYPVPIRTGHLWRALDWLGPNESKSSTREGESHDIGPITAKQHEVIVYNSASYARAVFLGLGSSSKYGKRDALRDGLRQFNAKGGIKKAIEDEIKKELNKR